MNWDYTIDINFHLSSRRRRLQTTASWGSRTSTATTSPSSTSTTPSSRTWRTPSGATITSSTTGTWTLQWCFVNFVNYRYMEPPVVLRQLRQLQVHGSPSGATITTGRTSTEYSESAQVHFSCSFVSIIKICKAVDYFFLIYQIAL